MDRLASTGFQERLALVERQRLGAREYGPLLGRFISADPLMNPLDAQQLSGYAYANYSPVTFMDPTGMACEHARATQAMYQSCMAGVAPDADKPGPLVDGTKCTNRATMETCAATGGFNPGGEDLSDEYAAAGLDPDEVREAEEVANTSMVDVIIDVGADILLDFLGVNDIMDCLGKGDMWACGSLLLDFIPWAKVAKIDGRQEDRRSGHRVQREAGLGQGPPRQSRRRPSNCRFPRTPSLCRPPIETLRRMQLFHR